MYYYIKGELVARKDGFAVIDNGGVGYKLYASAKTLDSFREGDKVTLYTYLNVREDVFDLFGFATEDEHAMFQNLLSVSGVGPKAALAVLSVVTPKELALAVITKNAKLLTQASGVGAKMAQRIILELSDKLKNSEILPGEEGQTQNVIRDSQSEAVSALMVLGYSQTEAKSAVLGIDETLKTEEIVKLALAKLMR
ncbi:MAG: Holliday junction branch migration protein RuvA [Clostridia bacterium]|nr:Holliday junction branch migration protein RuvA [Clostridia bacterium]